jgi:flagellar basal-body rod modification protein FlgD
VEVNPFDTGSSTVAGTTESTNRAALGQKDFLRMLIAQLENQDPLNPQDPSQFSAQLATFSSLEQLLSIRTGIDKLASSKSGGDLISAATLVGRDVVAKGAQFDLAPGAVPELSLELDGASTSTRVEIVDTAGGVVRTLDLGALAAGRTPIAWDGAGESGQALPAGTYGMRVRAEAGGAALDARTYVRGIVSGTAVRGGSPVLFLGSVPVPLGDVEEVRAAGTNP